MNALFREVKEIHDVKGILLISLDGRLVYQDLDPPMPETLGDVDWKSLSRSMTPVSEAELVFERYRLFARRTDFGCLVVIMGWEAVIAMVRLKCNEIKLQ